MTRHLGPALALLVFLTACDGNGRIAPPAQPSPPTPAPPSPATVTGHITITSISPQPGSTVAVRACSPHTTQLCADEPKLTVEVVIEQVSEDIPNAILTVSWDQCGYWSTPVSGITAGTRRSLTTSVISLSDHEGPNGAPAPALCEFPAVTTGIVVSLSRAEQPMAPLLTKLFVTGYTFARP